MRCVCQRKSLHTHVSTVRYSMLPYVPLFGTFGSFSISSCSRQVNGSTRDTDQDAPEWFSIGGCHRDGYTLSNGKGGSRATRRDCGRTNGNFNPTRVQTSRRGPVWTIRRSGFVGNANGRPVRTGLRKLESQGRNEAQGSERMRQQLDHDDNR